MDRPDPRGPSDPIARQLHDIVVPQLFVLSSGLTALRRRAHDDVGGELLDELAETAARALADLRAISRGRQVRPATALGDLVDGLVDAMHPVSTLGGCEVTVTGAGHADLPAGLVDDVIATAWEGVANAVRHGRARRVHIDLTSGDAGHDPAPDLTVTVVDDGTWRLPTDPAATGLAGLRRRAGTWGGSLDLHREPTGTRLVWQVPLPTVRPVTAGR